MASAEEEQQRRSSARETRRETFPVEVEETRGRDSVFRWVATGSRRQEGAAQQGGTAVDDAEQAQAPRVAEASLGTWPETVAEAVVTLERPAGGAASLGTWPEAVVVKMERGAMRGTGSGGLSSSSRQGVEGAAAGRSSGMRAEEAGREGRRRAGVEAGEQIGAAVEEAIAGAERAAAAGAYGQRPVAVTVPTSALILNPDVVFQLRFPVHPLTADVDLEGLHALANAGSMYGMALLLVGLIVVIVSAVVRFENMAMFLGWLLLLWGAFTGLTSLSSCAAPGASAWFLLGLLHLAFGAWLLMPPAGGEEQRSATALTLVVPIWFLAQGVVRALLAILVSMITSWSGLLFSSFLSLAFAFVVFWTFPAASLWTIGVLIGADFMVLGVAFLLLACMAYAGEKMLEEREKEREPFLHPLEMPTSLP